MPGRQGGRGKGRRPTWQHQTKHELSSQSELKKPLVTVDYQPEWGLKVAEAMYLFDQEAAKLNVHYCVDGGSGSQQFGYNLKISVSKSSEDKVREIVARLQFKAR